MTIPNTQCSSSSVYMANNTGMIDADNRLYYSDAIGSSAMYATDFVRTATVSKFLIEWIAMLQAR
ncbi:hypothetical protein [Hyphomonas oceanitis]|uniref:hypothetical protein n=1 Tax=Hyphomonas oceanitis TaxID=81033 RepID=UPI0030039723